MPEELKTPKAPETQKSLSEKLGLEDVGEMDYEIKLNELYHEGAKKDHDIKDEAIKTLKENGRETGLNFINAVNSYVQGNPEKIRDYLGNGNENLIGYDAETKTVKADIRKIVDQIGAQAKKLGIPTDEFVAKLEEIKTEVDSTKSTATSIDAHTIQNTRLVGWLFEHLHVLHLYEKKKKELEEKKARLDEMKSIKNGDVHIRNMASRPSALDVWKLSDDVVKSEIELKRVISAYGDVTRKESYDESKLKPVAKLRNEDRLKALSLFQENIAGPIAHTIANPILAGLMTRTDPKNTGLYLKIIADEKEKIGGLFKKFGIDIGSGKIDIEAIKSDLARQKHSGFLTPEEVSELTKFYKELFDGDKQKEQYLDALQKDVNKFNAGIEAKIAAAEVTDDDLNKLRLIQAALLLSPFFGISLVPLVVSTFLPFFEGQEMAQWVGSLLSTDGPFSWLATVADKVQLDELTTSVLGLFDGVLSLPEVILTGENNPISILFRNVVGEGLANSPFGNWVIALFVNQYSNYFDREIKLSKDKDSILQNAKKGLKQLYEKFDAQAKEKGLGIKDVIEYRTDLAIASKMSVWLQNKNSYCLNKDLTTCKEFVEQVLKGNKGLSDKILGFLEKIENGKALKSAAEGETAEEQQVREGANKAKTKAAEDASLELLELFKGELKEPTKEFKQFFEFCFAKDQGELDKKFFNRPTAQGLTIEKKFQDLNDGFNKKVKNKEESRYEQKLEILKAREKIELAGEYGVDTGYPSCYGEELLYLDLLDNLHIDQELQLSKELNIPNFDPSTGQAARYDINLLDDLILLDYLKRENLAEYNKVTTNGLQDKGTLKKYLIENNLMQKNLVEETINASRNIEVKKRVVAIQDCLEIKDSKDSLNENKTDHDLYQECLNNLSNRRSGEIDTQYEEVKNKYDDRVVKAAEKIDKESFNRHLTPTTSVTRFNSKGLSVTQLVESAQEFGR